MQKLMPKAKAELHSDRRPLPEPGGFMAQRNRGGSVVLDKRNSTWMFYFWHNGTRHSKRIGNLQQYRTKAAAWRAAKPLRDSLETKSPIANAPKMSILIEQYRSEKMPKRQSTRQGYNSWLNTHILPTWGEYPISDLQARPVEMWLGTLPLSPKSKSHIRGLLHVLWDYAQWRGDVVMARNPMELVTLRGVGKRKRKPRSLTVEEFQKFAQHLEEPGPWHYAVYASA